MHAVYLVQLNSIQADLNALRDAYFAGTLTRRVYKNRSAKLAPEFERLQRLMGVVAPHDMDSIGA